MKMLPSPGGPYFVGSTTRDICDSNRPRHLVSQESGRRIFVKFWYPADPTAPEICRREMLWEQLRRGPDIPGVVKLFLHPAMKLMTNSYERAPYAHEAGPPRILFYSHGLISFASESTMLMEHLASHGYVMISLQHLDQLPEFRSLGKTLPDSERREQKQLERRIKAASREERAAQWKEYFRKASNTNRIVSARAGDVDYATASLEALLDAIPGIFATVPLEPVGALGLSVGGAVATEYAKAAHNRMRCVINLDGGIYGRLLEKPIDSDYLMLYSDENNGINDLALTATDGVEIRRRAINGTRHLNFHDIAAIYPRLKWLGAIGRTSPVAALEERNQLVRGFVSDVAKRTQWRPA